LNLIQLQNWEQASAVTASSWKENRGQSLNYGPDFLGSLADYPGALPVLSPAFVDGEQLAAFVLGFPRTFIVCGRPRKLLLMSFFTVASGFKGNGLGRRIWAECLRQARDTGYDGTLHYCVEGNVSNDVTVAGARLAGSEARHIFRISYLMRFLHNKSERIENKSPTTSENFAHCASDLNSVPLMRVWSDAEVIWQLHRPRGIAITNRNIGSLTGYVIDSQDEKRTPILLMEDILWRTGTTLKDRSAVLSCFLDQAARVSSLAVVPVLGYADLEPFRAAGFRKSPQVLNAFITLFAESMQLTAVDAIYADVL
jgi:GNAT superfamily N-acetyltransferase